MIMRRCFAWCVALLFVLQAAAFSQEAQSVQTAMQTLKTKTAALGAPEIRGQDSIDGKAVPALWFGSTKINGNFDVVDVVQKEQGGVATLFVKSGEDYVRVSTNVKKDDGSRAVGTVLDPNGKAIAAIRKGQGYYGDADILGKSYVTGYEPIRDAKGQVIGIYFVGYPKISPSP